MGLFGTYGTAAQAILSMIGQGVAQDEARRANEKRYGQSTDITLGALNTGRGLNDAGWIAQDAGLDLPSLRKQNAETLGAFDAAGANADSEDAGVMNRFDLGANELQQAAGARARGAQNLWDTRYNRNMDRVLQLGGQERKDLEQSFNEQADQTVQDAAARGLGSSTVLSGLRGGVQREKTNALSRLNERILQNQINTDASLSGDAASANERLTGDEFNVIANNNAGRQALIQGQAAGRSQRGFGRADLADSLNTRAFNFGNSQLDALRGTIEGRTDAYPSQASFLQGMQGLGGNLATNEMIDRLSANTFRNFFGNSIGAGIGGGLGAGIGFGTAGLIGGGFGALPRIGSAIGIPTFPT